MLASIFSFLLMSRATLSVASLLPFRYSLTPEGLTLNKSESLACVSPISNMRSLITSFKAGCLTGKCASS